MPAAYLDIGFKLDFELGVFLPVSRQERLDLLLVLLLPLLFALHVRELHLFPSLEEPVYLRLRQLFAR